MELILVCAAIILVLLLCDYINAKDIHKEPSGLLISVFLKVHNMYTNIICRNNFRRNI